MEFLRVPLRAVTFSHILINADLPNCLKVDTFRMYFSDTITKDYGCKKKQQIEIKIEGNKPS